VRTSEKEEEKEEEEEGEDDDTDGKMRRGGCEGRRDPYCKTKGYRKQNG